MLGHHGGLDTLRLFASERWRLTTKAKEEKHLALITDDARWYNSNELIVPVK